MKKESKTKNKRIQCFLNPITLNHLNQLMENKILDIKPRKGLIIDIAINELIKQMEQGKDLNNMALDYLNNTKEQGGF